MIEHQEFEGKDLEEALAAASSSLNVSAQDLQYEILEQGRRGVFGLGSKSVRIRIIPPLDDVEAPDESEEPQKPARRRSPRRTSPESRPRSAEPRRQVAPEVGDEVLSAVNRMLKMMRLEVEAKATSLDDGVTLEVDGEDRKLLLDGDAELLSAMQLLLNRMARRTWPEAGRIQLLCNGRRSHRDEEIIKIAEAVATQVARSGRTQTLEPMNAYERRLVHLAVREHAGLSSSSDGQGALKRIRVSKVKNRI